MTDPLVRWVKIKIDKGIPLPDNRNRFPWAEMEVLDSFFIEGANHRVHYTAVPNKSHKPKKFTQRKVKGGVRIWRIE